MATMERLLADVPDIIERTYQRKNSAELLRKQEYDAAVRVQAWFRGTRVRSYLRHLNACATIIQKTWRGFLGQRFYQQVLKTQVFIMRLYFYNSTVTKIQKVWRGFYTRKYIFDYFCRKRYLDALAIKNNCVRAELKEYAEQQEDLRRRQTALNEMRQREYEARKTHYLISTIAQPGIYNSPFLPYSTPMEHLLASVRPLSCRKTKNQDDSGMFDPAWQRYDQPKPKELPPLCDKPQGPFRPPTEVQSQRYKPFRPTLRVETDFYCLDKARAEMQIAEWIGRINDDKFVPFYMRGRAYEPLLHTTSKFGHLSYGSKYFREERIDQHVTTDTFKCVVPPIPIFDKFNQTYSQGEV